jgi:hypothetical protein
MAADTITRPVLPSTFSWSTRQTIFSASLAGNFAVSQNFTQALCSLLEPVATAGGTALALGACAKTSEAGVTPKHAAIMAASWRILVLLAIVIAPFAQIRLKKNRQSFL